MTPTNRTVLITGATGGIGSALARELRDAGFQLFLTGRDPDRLAALTQALGAGGLPADLTEVEAAERVWRTALETLGNIDVLVNNAGFNKAKDPIVQITPEDLERAYAVNLRAPILLSRLALQHMGARRVGHIVNVISSVVHMKAENFSVYSTMKYGLHGFTGCLIKEARQVGVKVTALYPGGVDTGFRPVARPDYLRPESAARMIRDCIMAPEDVVVHELTFRPMVETNF